MVITSDLRTLISQHGQACIYVTGDGCQREANGFITLKGRVDDVVNVRYDTLL
jgi:acyl-coenzyme A synthetase/AMP-(fatty) acid ligase